MSTQVEITTGKYIDDNFCTNISNYTHFTCADQRQSRKEHHERVLGFSQKRLQGRHRTLLVLIDLALLLSLALEIAEKAYVVQKHLDRLGRADRSGSVNASCRINGSIHFLQCVFLAKFPSRLARLQGIRRRCV